jgi:lipoyl(octanoyl) transferase
LNVNTDLSYFNAINPCGFTTKGVTSIAREIGHEVDMRQVKNQFTEIFKSLI